MSGLNVFRILGDVSHTVSKCILIWSIHINRSAEGVSLITQSLYALVFCSRYLDLLWTSPFGPHSFFVLFWNFFLKLFYISSSLYIVFVMLKIYARTREREKAWKFGSVCFGGSLIAAPFIMMIFRTSWSFYECLWVFSIILESVCVLPQLILLRQTTVPTVIDSFYLLTLGSYRAFYILNWIVRGVSEEHYFDPIAVIFGIIQTAFYLDFAWVYWTRQRVKLRNGAIVDSEDLSRGFLVSKVLGHAGVRDSVDEEAVPSAQDGEVDGSAPRTRRVGSTGGWGARGISVSADDSVYEQRTANKSAPAAPTKSKQKADANTTPEEIANIFGNDSDDSDADDIPPSHIEAVGNGSEWRRDGAK